MRGIFVLLSMALIMGCATEIETFEELVERLDATEQEIRARQDEIQTTISQYNETHPENQVDAESLTNMALNPDHEAVLNEMLATEADVSYRGLVQEIIDTRGEVAELQQEMQDLRDDLPAPYTVQRGDSHLQVALEYLMENHGLSAAEARDAVEQTALVESLNVGNQVWLLYMDGMLGTYVTQGTADMSPGRAQRIARARINRRITTLSDERDAAQARAAFIADSLNQVKDMLEERIVFLRSEEERLNGQIAMLSEARDDALAQRDTEEQAKLEAEMKLNSIFYAVNTMDHWKDSRVIKDPFFGGPRVESLSGVGFSQSQDLREGTVLTIERSAFPSLKRIKKVDVFPRTFREGQDYVVAFHPSGERVSIELLAPDNFTGQNVLLALRD
jgi:hypothetical protein